MIPRHVDHRPLTATHVIVLRPIAVAAAARNAGLPFVESHRILSDRELSRKGDLMLWALVEELAATGFGRRRPHDETARRHNNHFRALNTFLETILRLEPPFLPARHGCGD